jgi:hypothetical protein
MIAAGETHGIRISKTSSIGPEGAGLVPRLSKQIPFIKFHTRIYQQLPILIMKGLLHVVILLTFDVLDQLLFFIFAMRKRSISVLPVGKTWENIILLDPLSSAGFDVSHKIGQAAAWM